MRKHLLLGTRNPGKLREITSILEGSGWSFSSLQDFDHIGSAEENGLTYAENAIAKAQFYAAATGLIALADDSGLEVAALDWRPGIHSARYAGDNASDADRRQLLLSELSKSGNSNRRARFVCVVAIANPRGTVLNISEGICHGTITSTPHGAGGFGYDPLFIPDGHTQTFAELPEPIKNLISHRALALVQTKHFLAADLRG
ncbi:MAG TPA: RdgB/HAM1 family non-canonical purine NTP pyrophosphatase [Pyrinomonadaceae bacterium]